MRDSLWRILKLSILALINVRSKKKIIPKVSKSKNESEYANIFLNKREKITKYFLNPLIFRFLFSLSSKYEFLYLVKKLAEMIVKYNFYWRNKIF